MYSCSIWQMNRLRCMKTNGLPAIGECLSTMSRVNHLSSRIKRLPPGHIKILVSLYSSCEISPAPPGSSRKPSPQVGPGTYATVFSARSSASRNAGSDSVVRSHRFSCWLQSCSTMLLIAGSTWPAQALSPANAIQHPIAMPRTFIPALFARIICWTSPLYNHSWPGH